MSKFNIAIGSRLRCVEGASQEGRAYDNGSEEVWETGVALYEKYYGKAAKQIIKDWFSLSNLIAIEPS
jgi:hypothetical protein